MYVESHWLVLNDYFEHEIGRRAWLDGLAPNDTIVLRMYQRFVQIQHQGLAFH